MDVFRIFGGAKLRGKLEVDGAKNAVLPILAAALLTDEPVTLRSCPRLVDTENMRLILETLGVTCGWDGHDIHIDASTIRSYEMPGELSKQLRSSIFMLGPLLGRFRKATVTYPGGCEIGQRPIDLHLKALRALGIRIREAHGMIYCDGSQLHGENVHLDFPSVGATENVMMAAVLAPGVTTIHNAAREPEIIDLQHFINEMGGQVRGAGGNVIEIIGVKELNGATYRPLSDRIVTGTLLTAAAMTKGEITLTNAAPGNLYAVLDTLQQAGCEMEIEGDQITLMGPEQLRPIEVTTQPFPGFPTDMQAQVMAMSTLARGTSIIVENLFENRFAHAAMLRCMGADIIVQGQTAIVRGGHLTGARVGAKDLRGGAALVLAGLAAEGTTEVEHTQLIDRGYESLERSLRQLGA
ncbi:UDP-N-acetylglucosamine 1-carboxyvinyltransferase, partial [Eubacteriales bacterium OttesenSCG-928-N13]|nr:UDP-N-acetylglucosamine 1-carboxyvinyltransferase [Eubacteriales bacterium OttesenSCG-928-N13]